MDVVLTIIDTTGIQDYIFGSNRLRENIGASFLVVQATHDWVYDQLDKLGNHNVAKLKAGEIERKIDRGKKIEDGDLLAEVIYAGGGNTAIIFRCPDEGDPKLHAKTFAWKISTRILQEAPGLEVVIAHSSEPFEWDPSGRDLAGRVNDLRDHRLTWKKRTRQAALTPLLGLGVTAECESTGLVASERTRSRLEPEPRLVSREIIEKLENRDAAKGRLQRIIAKVKVEKGADLRFADELDHLGRSGGEESYIAVVHVDGNEMGTIFSACGNSAANNRDYIEKVGGLSDGIHEASQQAIAAMFAALSPRIKKKTEGEKDVWTVKEIEQSKLDNGQLKQFNLFQDEKKMSAEDRKPCWPILPLVYGGDDITFVCNGQLGLSLAEIYMKAFTRLTRNLSGGPIQTGAGVCIVKVHYPFRRAYQLSDTLAKSAKRFIGDKNEKLKFSALDWHLSTAGLSGKLGSIRKQDYETPAGVLTMRPVYLEHTKDWRTLKNLNLLVARFNLDENLAGRRNKIKALRELLRDGGQSVREFLEYSRITLPAMATLADSQPDYNQTGWAGDYRNAKLHCVYFDAIEAMDHHLLLEDVNNGSDNSNS